MRSWPNSYETRKHTTAGSEASLEGKESQKGEGSSWSN